MIRCHSFIIYINAYSAYVSKQWNVCVEWNTCTFVCICALLHACTCVYSFYSFTEHMSGWLSNHLLNVRKILLLLFHSYAFSFSLTTTLAVLCGFCKLLIIVNFLLRLFQGWALIHYCWAFFVRFSILIWRQAPYSFTPYKKGVLLTCLKYLQQNSWPHTIWPSESKTRSWDFSPYFDVLHVSSGRNSRVQWLIKCHWIRNIPSCIFYLTYNARSVSLQSRYRFY